MNRRSFAAAGLTAVLMLTGCSASSAPTDEPRPTSTLPTLGTGDVVSEDPDMLVDPDESESVPLWTDSTRQSARETAVAALTAWARPDLPHDQWWDGLVDHLTDGAREVVSLTDPANIPVTSVGEASIPDEGQTAYVGWVAVDTNDGVWWVLVAWQADGTWAVDRITQSHEVAP